MRPSTRQLCPEKHVRTVRSAYGPTSMSRPASMAKSCGTAQEKSPGALAFAGSTAHQQRRYSPPDAMRRGREVSEPAQGPGGVSEVSSIQHRRMVEKLVSKPNLAASGVVRMCLIGLLLMSFRSGAAHMPLGLNFHAARAPVGSERLYEGGYM